MSKRSLSIHIGTRNLLHLFAVVYAFMVWGFWHGMLSLVFPIHPVIDLVQWIVDNGWKA